MVIKGKQTKNVSLVWLVIQLVLLLLEIKRNLSVVRDSYLIGKINDLVCLATNHRMVRKECERQGHTEILTTYGASKEPGEQER